MKKLMSECCNYSVRGRFDEDGDKSGLVKMISKDADYIWTCMECCKPCKTKEIEMGT